MHTKELDQKDIFFVDIVIILTAFTSLAMFVIKSNDLNFNKIQAYESELMHFLFFENLQLKY